MPDFSSILVENLPDVVSTSIPEQKYFDGLPFPLVLTPTVSGRTSSEWQQWVFDNLNLLKSLVVKYGAILYRGFSMDTPADFDLFAKSFGWKEFPYLGGVSIRKPVVGNVSTSTEAPPDRKIFFHHEMAHVQDYPKMFFAYCDIPPTEGGETPLILSHIVHRLMAEREPQFVERLSEEGLCYVRVAPELDDYDSSIGRSWTSTFFSEDKETAEKNARKAGHDVEWLPDGCMKYTTVPLKAIRFEPRSGRTTWFNSCYTYYNEWTDARNDRFKSVFFPNGDLLPSEAMQTLAEVMEEAAVACRWQKGDVAMVDNELVQHGRNPFTPPRRVLVSLFTNH